MLRPDPRRNWLRISRGADSALNAIAPGRMKNRGNQGSMVRLAVTEFSNAVYGFYVSGSNEEGVRPSRVGSRA